MIRAILLLLALLSATVPLSGQRQNPPPPPPDDGTIGTQDLPPKVCPSDYTDGPLYGGSRDYYGIPAVKIVEGFLAPPHDSFGRVQSGRRTWLCRASACSRTRATTMPACG